jgi:pyruvate formate lyase activating enzyme
VDSGFVGESLLQRRANHKLRCDVCERRCLLGEGAFSWCRTRQHRDGHLVTLIYGAVSSLQVNPTEKKPFNHFYPGSGTLTAGSWSCNFGCPWCQNWEISRVPPLEAGVYLPPEQFVDLTEQYRCQGTSISFNEPTLSLEWGWACFVGRASADSTIPT